MLEYTKAKAITCGYGEINDYQAEFVGAELDEASVFKIWWSSESHYMKTRLFGHATVRSLMAP